MKVITIENQAAVDAIRDTIFAGVAKGLMTEDMTFPDFIRASWGVLEPATTFVPNWHIDCIAEYLAAVDLGQIQHLLINMPPRHMKSTIVTIQWPAWSWTRKPWLRWIFCSYAGSLSVKHSIDRRRIIDSEFYQERWGNLVSFAKDQNSKALYENTATGRMFASSTGGSLTGQGGDRLVGDDMLNPLEADSDAAREHALNFYRNVFSTRLNDKRSGAIILVEQRTHEKDISGHVLKNEAGWTHLDLQAKQEKAAIFSFPMSGRIVERPVDNLLWPAREDEEILAKQKKKMGPRAFGAQYQQRPKPSTGNILQRQWFRRWNTLPDHFDVMIHSWDMAFKDEKENSMVVGQTWGKLGADMYLLAQIRGHLNFPRSQAGVEDLVAFKPRPAAILIEDKANGPAIISSLQKKIPGLVPVPPEGSKVARASAISGYLQAGNILIPGGTQIPAPNGYEETTVEEFLDECAAFPVGDFNDQVDSMTQAVLRLIHWDAGEDEGEEGTDPLGINAGGEDEDEGGD